MYSNKTLFKKHFFFLMLLMAILMPWKTNAQETLTVYDGTATSQYIPMYGNYFDDYTKSECIIPASELTDMDGGTITAITFYAETVGTRNWANTNQKVFLKEVSSTTLGGSYSGMTDAIVVFDGLLDMPTTSPNGYTIPFSNHPEGYTYNGGNLLIGVYNDDDGSYNNVKWYGVSNLTSGVSAYGSNGNYLSSVGYSPLTFLPKTTFTYTPAAGSCGKPSSVTPDDITSNSATINWTGGSGTYNVEYKKASDSEWSSRVTNYSASSVELTGLEPSTSYQVRVQSICEGNIPSGWTSKDFDTPCAAEETFPFTENFESLTENGEIPQCWDNSEGTITTENQKWIYSTSSFTSSYGSTTNSGHNNSKCVRMNSYNPSSGLYNCLKTKPMNFPAGKTMQLTFWYKNPAGGNFSVYISTDGGTTYNTSNPLATGLTGQTDWKEMEITLSNYVGSQNVVIVFKGTSNCGYNDAAIYLDDVTIDEVSGCPKQSGLTSTALSSSSVTLDWTLGTNEQDHWDLFFTTDASVTPNVSTTPTVTNTNQKPYTHSGLSENTKYYAFVRARCSDSDPSAWSEVYSFTTTQIPVVVDAEHPFSDDFEDTNKWLFTNGDRPNQWCLGSAVNNGGSKAMYISNDNGTTNAYSGGYQYHSLTFASKTFTLSEGAYNFAFDWRCKGYYSDDFLRVALVPASTELTAGSSKPTGFSDTGLPTGWVALDGGSKLNWNGGTWVDAWTTVDNEINITTAGIYKMVFIWFNGRYGDPYNPPAGIDNVSVTYVNCPKPTALTANNVEARTATLSWTENGTATGWVLQYAKDIDFTTDLVEIDNGFSIDGSSISYNLTGLTGETSYYARVKSACESAWSEVEDFTTLPTCAKPTNWKYTSSSNTAYSGSVQWEGSANGYEIAYKPGTSGFDPSDETLEGVTRITLGSVNSYTLTNLAPETKYYVYIRANCGETDGMSAWSTNTVAFTTLASCVAPSSLTTSVTSSSITLGWTKGANDQEAWDIRYKKSGASEYTNIHLYDHPTPSYTITDLDPATTYLVNVRAWCDIDDQSKWGASSDKSVETECAALTLPYTYGFEENLQTTSPYSSSYPMPKCWNRIAYSTYTNPDAKYPYVFTANSSYPYAHGSNGNSTSGHSLYLWRNSSSSSETAILPEVDAEYEMNNIQVCFWARLHNSATNQALSIGVMNTASSGYTEVSSVNIESDQFKQYTVSLASYTGTGRYIAIKCGSGSDVKYYIDDITVEVIPSCLIPDNLDASPIEANEATLTWTPRGTETAWNLQYKKATDSNWSNPIAVSTTPTYTLTGLQRSTEYEARVQANCSASDQSEWSLPLSFTTECGIWTIHERNSLFEDFNSESFPPDCWQKVNFGEMGSTSGWLRNVTNSLDNQGAASSDFKYETWLFLPQMHLDGDAFLSFDNLFSNGKDYIPSSIMLSTKPNINIEDIKTTGFIAANFVQIWAADENNLPLTKRNEVVSLSDYNNDTVYIAFRYEGTNNYSGRMWYIDNVEVYINTDQTVELSRGWNWFSTYIELGDIDGLDMLKESLGEKGLQIKSRTDGYTDYDYDYGDWFGDLDDIPMTNEQMYMILTDAGCTVEMRGKIARPNHTITINPGWNWIGYPCDRETSVVEALSDFNPEEEDQIKSFNQYTDFENGEWFGELETMTPGFGFMYYSNSTTPKSLVYQLEGTRAHRAVSENATRYWTPVSIGDMTMTCTSVLVIDGQEQHNPQLEIGVFSNDGVCRGASLPKYRASTDRYIYSITIYGEEGYTYTCKVYDHEHNQELPLTFVPDLTSALTYRANYRYGMPSNPYRLTFTIPTFTKEIIGYGDNAGGYYLIASPVDDVNPTEITDMIADPAENYDLYWFDQTQDLEWRTYKKDEGFNLISGKGYLYANKNDVTLTFTGTPIVSDTYEVSLVKDNRAEFPGWNLVGNPFANHIAYIDRPFYVMNEGGTGIMAATEPDIAPMEGVFVIATEKDEPLTFSTTASTKSPQVTLNLSKRYGSSSGAGPAIIDRAIVRFGEGRTLPKFQLKSTDTKVYIPMDGQDYSVVRSESMGEMPVNFKAAENGTYSISVNTNEVEMRYFHLIDNMTGENVDLLQTPSYIFEAKTSDYASRFRLVYSSICEDADGDNAFAYFNGNEWVISTNGEATVQVIDAMGRVMSSMTINGSATVNTKGMSAGVYVLRLINGENVKVQKVVVR